MATRIAFTKKTLEELPRPTSGVRDTYLDTDPPNSKSRRAITGLQLTVSPTGTKAFVLCCKLNGRTKKITIGRFPDVTVENARKKAQKLRSEIADGRDPINERRVARSRGLTLSQVFEDYKNSRKLSENTLSNYLTIMRSHLADWMAKPLAEISRDMIEAKHSELSGLSPTSANKAMRVLRALFNYAHGKYEDENGRGLFPDNPVLRLTHTKSWNKETRRETVIRNSDLACWFSAVFNIGESGNFFDKTTSDFLVFTLLTGLRRREAASLTFENVDFAEKSFRIVETKNGKPLVLPMSTYTEQLLRQRRDLTNSSFVFPGREEGKSISDPRRQISDVRKISGVEFTIHDLRRTFATVADSLDISAYALKALVNHNISHDVTAGYVVINVERLREPMQKITDFILERANLT